MSFVWCIYFKEHSNYRHSFWVTGCGLWNPIISKMILWSREFLLRPQFLFSVSASELICRQQAPQTQKAAVILSWTPCFLLRLQVVEVLTWSTLRWTSAMASQSYGGHSSHCSHRNIIAWDEAAHFTPKWDGYLQSWAIRVLLCFFLFPFYQWDFINIVSLY